MLTAGFKLDLRREFLQPVCTSHNQKGWAFSVIAFIYAKYEGGHH